jgi:8-oxo-dGTP diphosphatase
MTQWRNPTPTVDIIIEWKDQGIILIERRHPPLGWALPGGFVDEGETVEAGALREALEETSLHVELIDTLGVYSDPRRDPRKHTMSVTFIARADGEPSAQDDAANLRVFPLDAIPDNLCFDHRFMIQDYLHWKQTGQRPRFGPGFRGLYDRPEGP